MMALTCLSSSLDTTTNVGGSLRSLGLADRLDAAAARMVAGAEVAATAWVTRLSVGRYLLQRLSSAS